MELAHYQSMSPPSPTQEIPNYTPQQISIDENTKKCNDIETSINLFGSFIIIREYSWISFSRSLETSIPSIAHGQGKLFDISKYKDKKYKKYRMGLDKNTVRGIQISK